MQFVCVCVKVRVYPKMHRHRWNGESADVGNGCWISNICGSVEVRRQQTNSIHSVYKTLARHSRTNIKWHSHRHFALTIILAQALAFSAGMGATSVPIFGVASCGNVVFTGAS